MVILSIFIFSHMSKVLNRGSQITLLPLVAVVVRGDATMLGLMNRKRGVSANKCQVVMY